MANKIQTVMCPRCGQPIELKPHPQWADRVIGDCECNRGERGEYRGPVIEMDATRVDLNGRQEGTE